MQINLQPTNYTNHTFHFTFKQSLSIFLMKFQRFRNMRLKIPANLSHFGETRSPPGPVRSITLPNSTVNMRLNDRSRNLFPKQTI